MDINLLVPSQELIYHLYIFNDRTVVIVALKLKKMTYSKMI